MNAAKHSLELGAKFPFDAPNSWWSDDSTRTAPPAEDWAHAAARGVVADLSDRRGIKNGFVDIEQSVRVELIAALSEIIRFAHTNQGEPV